MPLEELTNTGCVILGMIAEGHRTGYAIKAEVERSTRFYWSASIGGIYPELRRLQDAGLVSRTDDPRGGSRRHAYELTDRGRAALESWLAEPRECEIETRYEGMLKLRFASLLSQHERRGLISRMKEMHEGRLRRLRQRLDEGGFDDPWHRLTTEYGAGWNTWARDWCESVLQSIEREDPAARQHAPA